MMQAAEDDAGDIETRAEDARRAERLSYERAERMRLKAEAIAAEIAHKEAEEARLKAEADAEAARVLALQIEEQERADAAMEAMASKRAAERAKTGKKKGFLSAMFQHAQAADALKPTMAHKPDSLEEAAAKERALRKAEREEEARRQAEEEAAALREKDETQGPKARRMSMTYDAAAGAGAIAVGNTLIDSSHELDANL